MHEQLGLTKPLLEELYLENKLSVQAIAATLHVPRQSVSAALGYYGIPLRSRREAVSRGLNLVLTPEYLAHRRAEGATIAELAAEHGTTPTTITNYLVDAGLLPGQEPDPAWDDILTEEALRRDYDGSDLTLVEYATQTGAPQGEIRLRLDRLGIKVSRRRNSQQRDLPDARDVEAADAEGRPPSFPASDDQLRYLYVELGRSTAELASELDVSPNEVLRALCAAGIEVRTDWADRLSPAMLRRRYEEEGESSVDIARDVGTTAATVTKYLRLAGIDVRPQGETRKARDAPPLPEALLRVEYGERGRSAESIAAQLGTTPTRVLTELRRIGVPVREARGGARKRAELQRTLTAAYLQEQLVDRRRSLDDVASEHGTSARTVARYVERLGIDLPEDVPAHTAVHSRRSSPSGSAVAKIADAGLLAEGAALVLDVDRLPRQWRDAVRAWGGEDADRVRAAWSNQDGGALVWAVDHQPRSPNGLTQEIVTQAGLDFGPCQATRAWRTAEGTSLAELASTL